MRLKAPPTLLRSWRNGAYIPHDHICDRIAHKSAVFSCLFSLPVRLLAICFLGESALQTVPKSDHVLRKLAKRQADRKLETNLDEQVASGRFLACISSRPGQVRAV